jgi:hypothetical protein
MSLEALRSAEGHDTGDLSPGEFALKRASVLAILAVAGELTASHAVFVELHDTLEEAKAGRAG